MRTRSIRVLLLIAALAVTACAKPANYGLYRSALPRSILVLPPTNDSIEVDASYIYLSTITQPLAEMGYYVFPVAVIDSFMKDNGLPTPHEMNSVSLRKLKEVFNPDAVLYLHIEDWGQKYQILSSNTVVKVNLKLVDVKSGQTIWQGIIDAAEGSQRGDDNLLAMVVSAAIEQIVESSSSRTWAVARGENQRLFSRNDSGLLLGPYHPEFTTDPRGR